MRFSWELSGLYRVYGEHAAIGIVLDALILGGGIVMVLDPWVVIILAVVAGAIIAVLLVKGRGD